MLIARFPSCDVVTIIKFFSNKTSNFFIKSQNHIKKKWAEAKDGRRNIDLTNTKKKKLSWSEKKKEKLFFFVFFFFFFFFFFYFCCARLKYPPTHTHIHTPFLPSSPFVLLPLLPCAFVPLALLYAKINKKETTKKSFSASAVTSHTFFY